MGKCISKSSSSFNDTHNKEEGFSDHDEFDDLPDLNFKFTLSKARIRELKPSALKNKKASICFKLKDKQITFGEVTIQDEVLKYPDSFSIDYKTSLSNMNRDKLEVLVSSNRAIICSTEISIKSIIDGPVFQNMALISNGLIIGRISFDIEMLEISTLLITPVDLSCELSDNNVGTFSVAVKFASDFSKESRLSSVSEEPSWKFQQNQNNTPDLQLPVTMKNIRDAALQIRVYKHHKIDKEVAAECWVSFTKMFAEDMEAIYRTESFLESKNKEEGTRLDFEKLIKSMKRVHNKRINENLWLCGRKIGTIKGMLKMSGIPTFVQLISGVNTEKGYQIQSNVYMGQVNKKGKEDLPKKILEIMKITSTLEESVQYKPGKGGINYERELLQKKKDCFERLYVLLESSQKDSMVSFIYSNQASLIKSQEILISLGNHLVNYSKLVNYDIKPSYFRALTFLIKRGELDIGYLSSEGSEDSFLPQKTAIATEYLKFIHNVLMLALSRMAFKGVDKITEEFVYDSLSICWFRVPEFRNDMIELIKSKSYFTIEEWRKTDTDLDDENAVDISRVLDWTGFYSLIPSGFKKDSFQAALASDIWRQKVQKRGLALFQFIKYWVQHIISQNSEQILWASIPGYKCILKAFLIEMKERNISEYPEALTECAAILVHNQNLLNVMVRIVFSKTNIYDFTAVQECFQTLNMIFSAISASKRALPPTFDSEFFELGLKISLNDENGLNVAKCLSFIYNQYPLLRGNLRERLIFKLILSKNLKKYFFHWCRDLRNIFYYLLCYRVCALKHFYYQQDIEDRENDLNAISDLKAKLGSMTEDSCRKDQKPYFEKAVREYTKVRTEFKLWKKSVVGGKNRELAATETINYPQVIIKFSFMDLSEKKLEEKW